MHRQPHRESQTDNHKQTATSRQPQPNSVAEGKRVTLGDRRTNKQKKNSNKQKAHPGQHLTNPQKAHVTTPRARRTARTKKQHG